MNSPRSKDAVLTDEFMPLRAKILEIAAGLDRLDRAVGDDDERRDRLAQGIRILLEDSLDRAERVQLLFSREYDQDWRRKFDLSPLGERPR